MRYGKKERIKDVEYLLETVTERKDNLETMLKFTRTGQW